jgi:superfamily I DNA/RNA helicase
LQFWAGQDAGWERLRAEGVKAAEQVLHGRVDARPLISAQLHAEETIRIQLTQQQSRILRGIGARKRAAICGGAGTGKTLLAMEKARQLAQSTGDTLLLCYNRLLADYMKTACQGVNRLHPMSYHQLCSWRATEARRVTGKDLLQEARRTYSTSRPQDEFDLVLPHALALACEVTDLRFDAVVIDEGQDFKEEYWLPIEWLMRDPDQSYLYVFYDQNQSLYTKARSMPIADPPFVLTFNCRNTRRIHESAYRFFQGEPTDGPTENEGVPIAPLSAPSIAAQAAAIHAAVVGLIDKEKVEASQISVMVCGQPKEQFYKLLEAAPLPRGSRWVVEGAAADRGVRLETVRRFKGLEADIVFLWGLDSLPARDEREVLYVGISRAKSRLTIVGTEEACRRLQSLPTAP